MILLVSILFISSCANIEYLHKSRVDNTSYPISMSNQLFDENLEPFVVLPSMKVGKISITKRVWNLGTGYWTLSSDRFEFSNEINKQIEKAGGNAVVEFKIQSTSSLLSLVSWTAGILGSTSALIMAFDNQYGYPKSTAGGVALTTIGIGLPFIMPGYSVIEVSGTIVEVPDNYWK